MENNTGGSLNQNDQNQGSGSQSQQNQNDLKNDQQPSYEGMGRSGAQEQQSNGGQETPVMTICKTRIRMPVKISRMLAAAISKSSRNSHPAMKPTIVVKTLRATNPI